MAGKFAPGDLAYLTRTSGGRNVGLVVKCVECIGEFEDLGISWLVETEFPIETGCYISGNMNMHKRFVHPEDWMKKIDPKSDDKSIAKDKVLEKESS